MKSFKATSFLVLTTIAMLLGACKNPCKDSPCINGECSKDPDDRKAAICTCSPGYEGVDCGKGFNVKFSGTYTAAVTCNISGAGTHNVTIAPKAGTTDEAIISGLYYANGANVTAKIASDGTTFAIAKQDLGNSGYDLESTSGTINTTSKQITLAYKLYHFDSLLLETCTTSLVLQ
jgi:hypothetical protein